MIYIKATLTMKMEKAKLSDAEQKEIADGWEDLRGEVLADNSLPVGVIVDLKIEEVDE